MKKVSVALVLVLTLFSCKEQSEEIVPNYFKHGMNGNVKSVFTEAYKVTDGIKEEYPKHYVFLWGDKFNVNCSRKLFGKDGNLIEETTYHEWVTYTDSSTVTYQYDRSRLVSSIHIQHSHRYSSPQVSPFVYSKNGVLDRWMNLRFQLNAAKQISEIFSSYNVNGLEFSRIEVFNDDGTMVSLYDGQTKEMTIHNTFDENGNIVKSQEFGPFPSTNHNDTIIYTQFDDMGNWVQRQKVDLDRFDTIVQFRTIKYYEN